jgi:2-polyprenyl-3-methyl-5-hydroxy-6-metoxy-1,4-benzoquinol methylase
MSMETTPCEACDGRHFTRTFEKEGHTFYRCDRCMLERIDPQPSDATLSRVYGAHYYNGWDLRRNRDVVREMKMATFRRTIARVGPLGPGSKILDCGAATGFLMEVAEEAGLDPYGVELSEFGAAEIAKRFGADHVFQGQVEDARFPGIGDGDFAAVFMCDFLEHVRRPADVLATAHRLLTPGGTLAICAPKLDSLTHRVMRSSWTHYKLEHLFYFNADSLRRLLARAGFANCRELLPWKTMSLSYLRHQFESYPHFLVGTAVKTLARAVPAALQRAKFPVLMGEMLVYAKRP